MKVLLSVLFVLVALPLVAGESPSQVDEETARQVREKIEGYIKEDSQLKGSFLILDPRGRDPVALDFDHVHEGVKPHQDGFVACVDFKDRASKVYDVDVVVGKDGERMKVQELFMHKIEGKPVGPAPRPK